MQMPEITTYSVLVPAVVSLLSVLFAQVGAAAIARRKENVDTVGLLSASEREFRRDILARLKHCEARHDECREELAKRDDEIARLRQQGEAAQRKLDRLEEEVQSLRNHANVGWK